MANDISLTSGMRSNLLSLQNTVNLLNRTQNRLSSGKKVNSAIDNPVSFFASQALSNRASKIDSLKDAMGQAVQTITAADKGITAITAMIEQAKGIAQSAQSAAEGITDTKDLTSVQAGTVTVSTAAMVTGDVIKLGGATIFTADADPTQAEVITAIKAAGGGNEYDATVVDANTITVSSKTGGSILTTDFAGSNAHYVIATDDAASDYTVGGTKFTAGISFDVGATAADSAANLAAAIVAAGIGDSTSENATVTTIVPSTELTNLQDQYNDLLDQISTLADDSGYKGKNLLGNDTLTVRFEGDHQLAITGFSASAGDLGIDPATWGIGGDIDADVTALDGALDTLSQQSSMMSGNLSIITVRQDFSTNMINTLTEGSDKLTLADTNEEGANMLMLQTRQSLSTTALSLSAQAAQSVLRLFQ